MCSGLKICPVCSFEFKPKTIRARVCSTKCRNKLRYLSLELPKGIFCLECGKSLKDKQRNSSFCSRSCKDTNYNNKNKEQTRQRSKNHYQKNKDYYYTKASIRNSRQKLAIPKWADKQDILDVYKEARYMQLVVDHIIPLHHPLVCGLHVWDNLQLLSKEENLKKGNTFRVEEL